MNTVDTQFKSTPSIMDDTVSSMGNVLQGIIMMAWKKDHMMHDRQMSRTTL